MKQFWKKLIGFKLHHNFIDTELKEIAFDSGAYAILYYLKKDREITISKLGTFTFKKGFYIYSGSAKKNLHKRVLRHLRKDNKKLKWHIDFFMNDENVSILSLRPFSDQSECEINKLYLSLGGQLIIEKFGASDCKNKCGSHFLFLPGKRFKINMIADRNN